MARHTRNSRRRLKTAGAAAAAAGFIAAGSVALAGTPQQQAADGPEVVGGVATFHSDATIGRLSVPSSWKKIVIGEGVTLRGNFLIPADRTTALTIQGEDAETSRLVGDGGHVKDTDFAAVSTEARMDLTLRTFTSLNPRHFHIIAKRAKVLASGIRVIDDRDEYHNNSDGFGGGDGSVIENSYFDTWDDTFKLYNGELTVRNTTVLHNANGAPVQMAWGDYGEGTLVADGLKVVSHSKNHYNQGLFSWAGGTKPDSRAVQLTGRGLIRSTAPGMRTAPLYVWKDGVRNKTITVRGGVCSVLRSTAANTVFEEGARNNTVRVTDCA
ncbi:hypothetical protein ABZY20_07415 [Streptomyces sp. NPDC006624]|uniref:hypothetical protein n=1 Tax=Streptomyces sp. NPDC006624 TaxID=3154892 RepID=UPI0033A4FDA9